MSITKQASSDLKIKAIKYYYKVNNYSFRYLCGADLVHCKFKNSYIFTLKTL